MLYIHGKGEHNFLYYDYWPWNPQIYHSRKGIYWEDVAIEKEIHLKQDNCQIGKDFSAYFGRLKDIEALQVVLWN